MSDEKTRVVARKNSAPLPEPEVEQGRIVFFCPAGHRIVVPVGLAGKRGKCSKCSEPVLIPEANPGDVSPTIEIAIAADDGSPVPGQDPPAPVAEVAAAPAEAPGDEGDWNFISGIDGSSLQPASEVSSAWAVAQAISPDANPMARLLARLWAERDHGGIVELHLVGGAVILPEEFSPRWSGDSHGVFASQAADGSLTITAVAWDTVQRIVVRQLTAVPGDMFE